MRNKTGVISGFTLGFAGFLFLFKVIFLKNIAPSDELAPGIVVTVAILNGFLFAFVGRSIQTILERRKTQGNN